MDRDGSLPDRCVVCNAQAGRRVSRTLYWSPAAWRYSSVLAPFALLFAGVLLGIPWLALAFWPSIIVLGIAHYVVRKKMKLDLGICERHRRQRNLLQALSIASLAGALIIMTFLPSEGSLEALVAAVAVIIVLAVLQSFLGVQAVSLRRLDGEHAWLGGTGRHFREALPELPH
jgi:hypothetical protein